MSLSPRGSTMVRLGHPVKGWLIMLIGGVLAWITGMSWSIEASTGDTFQVIMAFGTLLVMAVPAQMIAGRTTPPWAMAAAGAVGLTVPWFFSLAVARQGQAMVGITLTLLAASYALTYVVSHLTRYATTRWGEL
ncbi:hypothetical protein ACQBAT_13820 [Ornithinimicrobium sp. Y1847]|uniref:hypothetical protein n=1 Tax=unclassified Ornithinimicrobium TaxID=2615080 RepID=UPI003B676BF6